MPNRASRPRRKWRRSAIARPRTATISTPASRTACSSSWPIPAWAIPVRRATARWRTATRSRVPIWDDLLNANYKTLLGELDADQTAKAKAMQRAWISYRDTTCQFYYDKIQGSMALMMIAACVDPRDGAARHAARLLQPAVAAGFIRQWPICLWPSRPLVWLGQGFRRTNSLNPRRISYDAASPNAGASAGACACCVCD